MVAIQAAFETHALTLDDERGRGAGWLPGQWSEQGVLVMGPVTTK